MSVPVHIPNEYIGALVAEAQDRNVTAVTLAAAILSTVAKDEIFEAVLEGVDLYRYGAKTDEPTLTPRAEEALSYLQGLAPVGEEFELNLTHAAADLGVTRQGLFNLVSQLRFYGLVEKTASGRGARRGVFRVLKRLEALQRERAARV